MHAKENVVVLSLGQMVSSNVDASIAEFARILDSKGVNLAEFRTQVALAADMAEVFNDGTISQYKKGQLDWKGFYQKLNAQLPDGGGLTEAEFKGAWNKMCEIKPAMVSELNNLASLQKEKGLNIVIASATNKEHFNFISDQFAKNDIKFDKEKTFYGLSYEKGTLDNADLAQQALKENGLEGANILSLHGGIPAGTKGVQIPTNPDKGDSICGNIARHFGFQVERPSLKIDVDRKPPLVIGEHTARFVERKEAAKNEIENPCVIF
jgi:di/tripeptidase